MRLTFIFAVSMMIGMMSYSGAWAQRDLFRNLGRELGNQGREVLRRELGGIMPQQGQPPQQGGGGGGMPVQRSAVPSEGGGRSGGDRRDFMGDGGFLLPGGGMVEQSQPIFQQPGFSGQPIFQGQPQPVNGQFVQPGGSTFLPGSNQVFPSTPGQPQFVEQSQPIARSVSPSDQFPGNPVMSNQYVVIRCPDSVSGSIAYTLSSNGRSMRYTMSAGQEQRFRVGTSWVIEYRDGSTLRKYALTGGKTYTMRQENDGRWQLYSIKSQGS